LQGSHTLLKPHFTQGLWLFFTLISEVSIVAETGWPTKPKIFTLWPFIENVWSSLDSVTDDTWGSLGGRSLLHDVIWKSMNDMSTCVSRDRVCQIPSPPHSSWTSYLVSSALDLLVPSPPILMT
jgi:hypothetical protein